MLFVGNLVGEDYKEVMSNNKIPTLGSGVHNPDYDLYLLLSVSIWVSWFSPDEGTVKVNVDGNSLGNSGRAGFLEDWFLLLVR